MMLDLDKKLLDRFQGYAVRKDIVRSIKVGSNVPVFVLEYLLANSCSTDDEQKIQEGIENVKRVLQQHYVDPKDANLIQAKIHSEGSYKVIDKISVKLDPSKDKYWAELSNLNILAPSSACRNKTLFVFSLYLRESSFLKYSFPSGKTKSLFSSKSKSRLKSVSRFKSKLSILFSFLPTSLFINFLNYEI